MNIAFVRIPKTASRSIKDTGLFICGGHQTLSKMREQYSFDKSFCVSRNPYDRMVSIYKQGRRYLSKRKWPYFIEFSDYSSFKEFCHEGIEYFITNDVASYQEGMVINRGKHPHFFPQSYWTDDTIDRILRFETIQEGWESLLDEWSIPFIELPHNNASNPFDYKDFYTEEIASIVYDKYKCDFERFKYNKESWRRNG